MGEEESINSPSFIAMRSMQFCILLVCIIIANLSGYAQTPEKGLKDATDESFLETPEVQAYFSLTPSARGAYFGQYMAPSTLPHKGRRPVLAYLSADVMLLDMETLVEQSMGFDQDWNTLGELQILNPERLPGALRDYQGAIREGKYLEARDRSSTNYVLDISRDDSLYGLESHIMLEYTKLVPTGRVAFIRENLTIIPLELLRLMQIDLNQLYRIKGTKPIATRPDMLAALANYH